MSGIDSKPTVVFGPFVGEFGWELLFWHGVVRHLCRTEFVNFHRIAIAHEGHEPFYPEVHEFRGFSDNELPDGFSARGYISDGWRDGWPAVGAGDTYLHPRVVWNLLRHRRLQRASYIRHWEGPDVEPFAQGILDRLTYDLNNNFTLVSPFEKNEIGGLIFGHDTRIKSRSLEASSYVPRLEEQLLQKLMPSESASQQLAEMVDGEREIVALLPRRRDFRRTDKNWSEEKYRDLIDDLQARGYLVVLVGAPNGAYFAENLPSGCIDLINCDARSRLDLQIALFQRASASIGAMSGAMLVALASGCPALIFGEPDQQVRYYYENFLNSPLWYLAELNPDPVDVMRLFANLESSLGLRN